MIWFKNFESYENVIFENVAISVNNQISHLYNRLNPKTRGGIFMVNIWSKALMSFDKY